jgi:addiction module HigA family antidote
MEGQIMTNSLLRGLRAPHPGRIIKRDVVPALGGNVSKIARELGISRVHLYDIMNCEKPITAPIAARMGRYFGNGGEIWLSMQARHDLDVAERSMADTLAAIEPAERVPEMA